MVRVTYLPPEEPDVHCRGRTSTVEDVVGGRYIVFVNRSATIGLGQLMSYVANVLPETYSASTVDTVVAHACNECSTYTTLFFSAFCIDVDLAGILRDMASAVGGLVPRRLGMGRGLSTIQLTKGSGGQLGSVMIYPSEVRARARPKTDFGVF